MLPPLYLEAFQKEALALAEDFRRRAASWREDSPAQYPDSVAAQSLHRMEESTGNSASLLRLQIELMEAAVRRDAHSNLKRPESPAWLQKAGDVIKTVNDDIMRRLASAAPSETETVVQQVIEAFTRCTILLEEVASGAGVSTV